MYLFRVETQKINALTPGPCPLSHPFAIFAMLLTQHLVEFFANLPFLSKIEVAKHFVNHLLIQVGIISENWTKAAKCQLKKKGDRINIQLKTFRKAAKIEICFMTWRNEDVELSIEFFLGSTEKVVFCDDDSIAILSKDIKTRELRLLSIIDLFQSFYQIGFHTIHVNFDYGYSLKFFDFLNVKSVFFLILESEKARINGAELEKILEKMEIRGKLELKMKSIRNFKGGEYLLNQSIILEDSRWVTGEMLVEKFNSHTGIFRNCRFTDKDYNQLLIKLKDDKKGVQVMEFQSEKALDIDKVIRGLDAKPWDPAVRSRKKDVPMSKPLRIVDLANGWDFRTKSQKLITVCLSENRKTLQIRMWKDDKFPLRKLRKCLRNNRKSCIDWLEMYRLSENETEKRKMCKKMEIERLNAEIELIEEELKES